MTLTSATLPLGAVRAPEEDPVTRILGGLAVAVGGAALIGLCYVLGVVNGTGRRLDEHLMRTAMSLAAGYRDELRLVLDVAAPAAVVTVAVLVIRAWRRHRDRAVTVAAVVLGSQAVTQALKALLPSPSGWNSLPSGHVTVAITTLVAVVLLVPRLSRPVLVLAAPLVALTGFATMMVGWHRPADVLAAVGVVALVSGAACVAWAPAANLLPGPTRPSFR